MANCNTKILSFVDDNSNISVIKLGEYNLCIFKIYMSFIFVFSLITIITINVVILKFLTCWLNPGVKYLSVIQYSLTVQINISILYVYYQFVVLFLLMITFDGTHFTQRSFKRELADGQAFTITVQKY